MAKKEVVKQARTSTRKAKSKSLSRDAEQINKILIENFISLQKVMTNLAVKFDTLSDNISKLLQLFEISARSFVEKQPSDLEKDREFLDKLNKLLEQNKTIAKGLTLMEEKIRERVYGSERREEMPQMQPMQQMPTRQFSPSMMQPGMQPATFPKPEETEQSKFKKLPQY